MSDHDALRRNLREALPAEPDFPSAGLLDRIMESLPDRRHEEPPRRWRRRTWMPLTAMALLLLILGVSMLYPRLTATTSAGRVEALANLGSVEFLSSQAQPEAEYKGMVDDVLPGFSGHADFNSEPTAVQDIEQIVYQEQVGQPTMDLIGLTHSDMAALQAQHALEDLTPLLDQLQTDRQFSSSAIQAARFGTKEQYYIPWLQATYMLVVNTQALPYLPAGANRDHLTYEQLIQWGQNLRAATGRNMIGLPAELSGPTPGLIPRFLQGYTYPSFTGSTLTDFKSPDAVQMWQTLRRLWEVSNPASTSYNTMENPLLDGDVWIAWDHQARLKDALADSHFVALPAPSGPRGLGFMSVTVGLAIPRGAHNVTGAKALIEWLTRPSQQAAASVALGFFPAVQHVDLNGVTAAEARVAAAYRASTRQRETLPPEGLGSRSQDFSAIYGDTFRRIVVDNEDIQTVLNQEATRLQQIVDAAAAPCWAPDPPSVGPCQIK